MLGLAYLDIFKSSKWEENTEHGNIFFFLFFILFLKKKRKRQNWYSWSILLVRVSVGGSADTIWFKPIRRWINVILTTPTKEK
jgi:hypothetical protein